MIVFFPTYARRLPGEHRWHATVAGMVTRPLPPRSRRRAMAMAVLKRLLDLDDAQVGSEVFQRRADAFLFQRVAGQPVRIVLGGRLIDAGHTDRTGHFRATFDLDETAVPTVGPEGSWIPYAGLLEDDESTSTADTDSSSTGTVGTADGDRIHAGGGRIQLVGAHGLSVVTDIDDTVKVTNVANRRELLANTFVREFQAVPGMVDIYRRWQDEGT
ncbi:MAG: phosphatase domain-containing protein, partial [Planctomycetota bacterium]